VSKVSVSLDRYESVYAIGSLDNIFIESNSKGFIVIIIIIIINHLFNESLGFSHHSSCIKIKSNIL